MQSIHLVLIVKTIYYLDLEFEKKSESGILRDMINATNALHSKYQVSQAARANFRAKGPPTAFHSFLLER